MLYTALFTFLYDHNKQQQRKYEGWIPCKTKPSRLKKYVLGHLGYFCLVVMLRVLTKTFQVFMMFRWFQDYSLCNSLRKEAGRKEWGVKKKKKEKAIRCGLHLSLLQQWSCCFIYASITKVRCDAQGLNTNSQDHIQSRLQMLRFHAQDCHWFDISFKSSQLPAGADRISSSTKKCSFI